MAIDKVKRAFTWLRNSLRIIDRTTLPGEILGEIRPTLDTFGWDRLAPVSSGIGVGPQVESASGVLGSNTVSVNPVPEGVMRYVIYCSGFHDDTTALALSLQVRIPVPTGTVEIAIDKGTGVAAGQIASPIQHGLERNILLAPGERIVLRSVPDPGGVDRLSILYKFVDIDFGEYIRAIS